MLRFRIATLLTTLGLFGLMVLLGCQSTAVTDSDEIGGEPVEITGDIQPPRPVHQVPPVYPARERANHVGGEVVMRGVIDVKGRLRNLAVQESSGNRNLDQAALDAASQWTFRPAIHNGKPVPVYYTLTLNFGVR